MLTYTPLSTHSSPPDHLSHHLRQFIPLSHSPSLTLPSLPPPPSLFLFLLFLFLSFYSILFLLLLILFFLIFFLFFFVFHFQFTSLLHLLSLHPFAPCFQHLLISPTSTHSTQSNSFQPTTQAHLFYKFFNFF